MAVTDACISLLVIVATVMVTAGCRQVALGSVCHRHHVHCFLLELTGAFQICACTHELCLLADLPPKPHMVLTLVYIFTALHGLTLPGSTNNPSSSFQLFYKGRIPVKTWWLHTSAQFMGAIIAHVYVKLIWRAGILPAHSKALAESCGNPIQTTLANAFMLELGFSFLLHLTLLQLESVNHQTKIHLVALLITAMVYGGCLAMFWTFFFLTFRQTLWLASPDGKGLRELGVLSVLWGYQIPAVKAFENLQNVLCSTALFNYCLQVPLASGHLTGAIFNPALAFSMHLSCFSEKFWNYVLVYWVAPCIGSVLVVIAWDEVLPLLRREM